VKGSLANLITSSVEATYALKVLHSGTGDVNESDIMLAESAKGFVIGFDINVSPMIVEFAKSRKVSVKTYKTIYELTEDAQNILEGTATEEENKIKGRAEVIKLFKLESGDIVIGCKVIAGAIKSTSRVSIYDKDPGNLTEDDIPLYTGNVKNLKKGKDEVTVVGRDNECGILLKPQFTDVKVGMWIEVR
jgi:translation initiation factor IF-2